MKYILAGTVAAVALMAFQTQAAEKKARGMDADSDGKVSAIEFCAAREKMAEKTGKEFDKAAVEKQFAAKDKNKDGFLSGDELPAKKPGAKKEGAKKKPVQDDE